MSQNPFDSFNRHFISQEARRMNWTSSHDVSNIQVTRICLFWPLIEMVSSLFMHDCFITTTRLIRCIDAFTATLQSISIFRMHKHKNCRLSNKKPSINICNMQEYSSLLFCCIEIWMDHSVESLISLIQQPAHSPVKMINLLKRFQIDANVMEFLFPFSLVLSSAQTIISKCNSCNTFF